jgi:hypothetical protein
MVEWLLRYFSYEFPRKDPTQKLARKFLYKNRAEHFEYNLSIRGDEWDDEEQSFWYV